MASSSNNLMVYTSLRNLKQQQQPSKKLPVPPVEEPKSVVDNTDVYVSEMTQFCEAIFKQAIEWGISELNITDLLISDIQEYQLLKSYRDTINNSVALTTKALIEHNKKNIMEQFRKASENQTPQSQSQSHKHKKSFFK